MNCIFSDTTGVAFLKKIKTYKNRIDNIGTSPEKKCKILQTAYANFTTKNLKEIEKEIAISWIVLFQLHRNEIGRAKLQAVSAIFKTVFTTQCIRAPYFTKVVSRCEKQVQNNNFVLLKRACEELSNEETFPDIDRKIAIRWVNLFESHEFILDRKSLGRIFKVIHLKFVLTEKDINKRMTIICRDNEHNKFPLVLLLIHRRFQKIITHDTISLKHTTKSVMEAFQQYMWTLPQKPAIPPTHFVNLLDFARWINDTKLMKLCLENLSSQKDKGLSERASNFAIEGEKALLDGKREEAEKHFLNASSQRTTDYLSNAALGRIAMQKQEYKKATKYFEEASKYAHDDYYFPIFQAKAIIAHVQQFENGKRGVAVYLEEVLAIARKMALGEAVDSLLIDFFRRLREYCIRELELQKNSRFYEDINRWEKLVKNFQFQSNHCHEVVEQLNKVIKVIKSGHLSRAEILLKNSPSGPDQKNEYDLLQGEIQYEREKFQDAKQTFESIKTHFQDKTIILSEKKQLRLFYNLAKVYKCINMIDEAKLLLSEATVLTPNDKEIRRSLVLLDHRETLFYAPEYLEKNDEDKEVHYAYALALLYQNKFEKAKKHLLKADLSKAAINYFLGEITESKDQYFRRALKVALVDALEFRYCVEIAEHFLDSKEKAVWIEVEQLFQHYWQTNPKQWLGECYLYGGKFEKARTCFGDLCKQNEDNSKWHYLHELALFHVEPEKEKEHFLKAANYFRISLEEASTPVVSKDDLEYIYFSDIAEYFLDSIEKDIWIEVERLFQRFWEVNITFVLGKYHLEKGESEKAIKCFQYLCKQHPGNSDMFLLLGAAYFKGKAFDLADKAFRDAIKVDPINIYAYICYIQLGEVEGFNTIRERLKIITIKNPELMEDLFFMYPSFVEYLDIYELAGVRSVFQNIVNNGNATLLHYCHLAKIYQDTAILTDIQPLDDLEETADQEINGKEIAKRYYKAIVDWEDDLEVLLTWQEFLSIGFYALKQNDLETASEVALRLFEISQGDQNIEDIGQGLVALVNEMAQIAITLVEENSIDILLDLLWFIQKCLQMAEHFDKEILGRIQKVSIRLVLIALDKERDRAIEIIPFLEYFAEMPLPFAKDENFAHILDEYLQEMASDGSETYTRITTLLNAIKQELLPQLDYTKT